MNKDVQSFTKFIYIFLLSYCGFLLSSCGISTAISGANAVYHHNDLQHSVSDYYITFRIRSAIDKDPQLAQTNISVTSFNRIVLLTGQVATQQQRQHAASLAQNVPNILRIFNAIFVGSPLSSTTSAQDTWITTKIKTKLIANNDIDPSKIKIVTENHVVYLLGIVPQDQADIAVDLARNTAGVWRVVKIFYYVIMPKIN